MINIYVRGQSQGAEKLAVRVGGRVVYSHPHQGNVVHWGRGRSSRCWKCLNSVIPHNKEEELARLCRVGISTPWFSTQEVRGWLRRRPHHFEGNDLVFARSPEGFMDDLRRAAYWVERLFIEDEFRLHVFQERILRTALRVPKTPKAHPWVRAWRLGWRFDYGRSCQERLTSEIRDLARAAVRGLELDFGAVDIGVLTGGGSPVVLEVNTRPGLESDRTADVYARAFIRHGWS